jgi:hypothetical protein
LQRQYFHEREDTARFRYTTDSSLVSCISNEVDRGVGMDQKVWGWQALRVDRKLGRGDQAFNMDKQKHWVKT